MLIKNKFLVFFVLVLAGTSGCDKISAFFSGQSPANKDSKPVEAASPAAVSTPAVVSAPKPVEDPNAPLPANVLAKVGDWTLTTDDFKERLKNLKELSPQFDIKDAKSKKLVLEELINQ